MLVSHRKQFIYTKTIKTGSTSVEVYFEPYCFPVGEYTLLTARPPYESETGIVGFRGLKKPGDGNHWYNHMPAAEMQMALGEATWSRYFKFCCVRDPFDRMVSAFHYLVLPKSRCADLPFSATKVQFRDWILSRRYATDFVLNDWKICTIDDRLCVDYVIRYEQLLAGIEEVCRRLDVPYEPHRLLKLQGEYNPKVVPFAEYYDPDTAAEVADTYASQLRLFGYQMPTSGRPLAKTA